MTNEQRSYRAFPTDLEIRGDGRTLHGLAAPFETPTEIYAPGFGAYTETIKHGAFARTIRERGPERVRLLVQHEHDALPIGRALSLREDTAGLVGDFRVSATAKGDEVLELVRDGALDGLSIGFRVIRDDWTDQRSRTLFEIKLDEVSVVNFPAYDTARIMAVRSARATPQIELARKRLALLEKAVTQ